MKRTLIVCLAVVGIAFAVLGWLMLDDFIGVPPRAVTDTNMWILKRRILQFAHSHGELPHSLKDLPEMKGYYNDTRDGWGRDISFEVSTSGVVTLRSLGRDGVIGGSGEDADMIVSFPAHDSQGKWSDEMIDLNHNPSYDNNTSLKH